MDTNQLSGELGEALPSRVYNPASRLISVLKAQCSALVRAATVHAMPEDESGLGWGGRSSCRLRLYSNGNCKAGCGDEDEEIVHGGMY